MNSPKIFSKYHYPADLYDVIFLNTKINVMDVTVFKGANRVSPVIYWYEKIFWDELGEFEKSKDCFLSREIVCKDGSCALLLSC